MNNVVTFTRIQLTNWRWSWPSMLLTGIVVPVLMSLGLGVYALSSGQGLAEYAVVGGLAFSLLFELQGKIASNISFMKEKGTLDQMAATGANRIQFIVGSFVSFGLLTLPSVVVTPVVVVSVLGLSLSLSWFLVPALVFSGCIFLSIGMIIGSLSSNLEQVSSTSMLLSILMLSLGPVAVPEGLLPSWLLTVGKFNPAVHVGDILRNGLFGGEPISKYSVAYIIVAAVVLLLSAIFSLPWRDKIK